MANTWDPTDVPAVSPETLGVAMRLLLDAGRTPLLPQGLSVDFMGAIEQELSRQFGHDTVLGVAVTLRFRSLIDVLVTRRARELLKKHGNGLTSRAVATAAGMRLNPKWGFSPTKFVVALDLPRYADAPAQAEALAKAA